jgi:hypothetical protein
MCVEQLSVWTTHDLYNDIYISYFTKKIDVPGLVEVLFVVLTNLPFICKNIYCIYGTCGTSLNNH